MALAQFLDTSQWMSSADILDRQRRQLKTLLSHAFQQVPFYKRRLADAGFTDIQDFGWDRWHEIPLLTREHIQDESDSLLAQPAVTAHGDPYWAGSSGSTGKPVQVQLSRLHDEIWQAQALRAHRWFGRDVTAKRMEIVWRRDSERTGATHKKQWEVPFRTTYETGPLVTVSSDWTDVNEHWESLIRERPQYLEAYPSIIRALAQRTLDTATPLPFLRGVESRGEMVMPELRDLVRRAWGLPLIDMYGATEVGYMALSCPESNNYHVMAESVLLEVIDEQGEPCQPGEIGRVVVTPLHDFVMPLIRYAIGDFAEVGEPCSCGRGLPTLKRIVGRSRNLCVTPDGRSFFPALGSSRWRSVMPVRQVQLVQVTRDTIEVNLVPAKEPTPDQLLKFEQVLAEAFSHQFRFVLKIVDAISRQKNGKFEDFISLV